MSASYAAASAVLNPEEPRAALSGAFPGTAFPPFALAECGATAAEVLPLDLEAAATGADAGRSATGGLENREFHSQPFQDDIPFKIQFALSTSSFTWSSFRLIRRS